VLWHSRLLDSKDILSVKTTSIDICTLSKMEISQHRFNCTVKQLWNVSNSTSRYWFYLCIQMPLLCLMWRKHTTMCTEILVQNTQDTFCRLLNCTGPYSMLEVLWFPFALCMLLSQKIYSSLELQWTRLATQVLFGDVALLLCNSNAVVAKILMSLLQSIYVTKNICHEARVICIWCCAVSSLRCHTCKIM